MAQYGWGEVADAEKYCEHINRHRDINCYHYEKVTDDTLIKKMDYNQDGIDLEEILQIIADNDEGNA